MQRRGFLRASAGGLVAAGGLAAPGIGRAAYKAYGPGVTDTEIKLGQTMPYSGPNSALGTIGRATAAYYQMINEQGGVNGRKINLLSLDDGYSPPKTVELARRLVEQDEVLGIFGSLGTATNIAMQRYLNHRGVPQFYTWSGVARMRDPHSFPWTIGGDLAFVNETKAFGRYLVTGAKSRAGFEILLAPTRVWSIQPDCDRPF